MLNSNDYNFSFSGLKTAVLYLVRDLGKERVKKLLPAISKEFQDAAFALTEQSGLSGVVATETGYSVVHLDSRVPADEKQFEEKKNDLSEKLLNERRTQTFNDFLSDLRKKARVTSNLTQKKQ